MRFFCLLICLALPPGAQPKETYRLVERSQPGDRSTATERTEVRIRMIATYQGVRSPPLRFEDTTDEQSTTRILSMSPNGGVTGLRRFYSRARGKHAEPGEAPRSLIRSVEGKTVTFRRARRRSLIRSSSRISREDREDFRSELDDSEDDFYPDHKVAIGDTWAFSSASIAREFGAGTATARAKLAEIINYHGHRCARLELSMTFTGKMSGAPLYMRVNLEGEVMHSLDIQRALRVFLSGPIVMQGVVEEGGQKVQMAGTGRARFELDEEFHEIAGKPLKPLPSPQPANAASAP